MNWRTGRMAALCLPQLPFARGGPDSQSGSGRLSREESFGDQADQGRRPRAAKARRQELEGRLLCPVERRLPARIPRRARASLRSIRLAVPPELRRNARHGSRAGQGSFPDFYGQRSAQHGQWFDARSSGHAAQRCGPQLPRPQPRRSARMVDRDRQGERIHSAPHRLCQSLTRSLSRNSSRSLRTSPSLGPPALKSARVRVVRPSSVLVSPPRRPQSPSKGARARVWTAKPLLRPLRSPSPRRARPARRAAKSARRTMPRVVSAKLSLRLSPPRPLLRRKQLHTNLLPRSSPRVQSPASLIPKRRITKRFLPQRLRSRSCGLTSRRRPGASRATTAANSPRTRSRSCPRWSRPRRTLRRLRRSLTWYEEYL